MRFVSFHKKEGAEPILFYGSPARELLLYLFCPFCSITHGRIMNGDFSINVPPSLRSPGAVLAWSEACCDMASGANPTLALWRPEGVHVALGLAQNTAMELDVDAVRRDGVGLVRRQSGGGAVLLYPGVVCWEAWAGMEALERRVAGSSGIREAYRHLCAPVTAALEKLGLSVFHAGICDISAQVTAGGAARKLAGTAQLRKRDAVLVHGSLLVDADLAMLGRYLQMPSTEPDYRARRSHENFCATVAGMLGDGGCGDGLMAALSACIVDAAGARGWMVATPPEQLEGRALDLFRGKYADPEWNWDKKRSTGGLGNEKT